MQRWIYYDYNFLHLTVLTIFNHQQQIYSKEYQLIWEKQSRVFYKNLKGKSDVLFYCCKSMNKAVTLVVVSCSAPTDLGQLVFSPEVTPQSCSLCVLLSVQRLPLLPVNTADRHEHTRRAADRLQLKLIIQIHLLSKCVPTAPPALWSNCYSDVYYRSILPCTFYSFTYTTYIYVTAIVERIFTSEVSEYRNDYGGLLMAKVNEVFKCLIVIMKKWCW